MTVVPPSTAAGQPRSTGRAEGIEAERPRHPFVELVARYRAIFDAVWQVRGQLAGPTRLVDEAAFLPAALSLQETPVHPAPRRLAYAIMALFIIALLWTTLGKVDIVAVAPGRIVVSERTKLVQPLERSVVKRVLVQDGDQVQAGQPLVELDSTMATADKASTDEQVKAAQSDALRAHAMLNAMSTGQRPKGAFPAGWPTADAASAQAQLAAEWSDITAKLAKVDSEISRRRSRWRPGHGRSHDGEQGRRLRRRRPKRGDQAGDLSLHALWHGAGDRESRERRCSE
jgi:hemolysin D